MSGTPWLRLADAQNSGVSMAGRFDPAYNAEHALCLASLRLNDCVGP